jgi:hypothetical protein
MLKHGQREAATMARFGFVLPHIPKAQRRDFAHHRLSVNSDWLQIRGRYFFCFFPFFSM